MSEDKLKIMKQKVEDHIENAEKRMIQRELPVFKYKKTDPKKRLYPFCITTSKKAQEDARDYKLEYLGSGCKNCDIRKKLLSDFVDVLDHIFIVIELEGFWDEIPAGEYKWFHDMKKEYEMMLLK